MEEKKPTVIGFIREEGDFRKVWGFPYRIIIDAKIAGPAIQDDEMILVFDPHGEMLQHRAN